MNGTASPPTSIERALIDYADHHDQRAVESAADQAEVKGLLNLTSLAAAVQRNPGRHGAAVLARLLEDYTFGANLTESELEDEFFRFCDRQRLRRPESQVEIGPYRVDFYWREQRLAVETDSWRWHGGRSAWEEDGKRNLWLKTQKIEVARLTWRRIRREAKGAVTDLIALGGEGLLVA